MTAAPPKVPDMAGYLARIRALVLDEIRGFIPAGGKGAPMLYALMLDYPMRSAKALRPALCIAACRALGGHLDAALPTAATLEFFHNAFLIHDDIEDGSELRRGAPTLHRSHGVPVAINVGDAMLALALGPLLKNTERVGLGPALRVLEAVHEMCVESVEGQAIELDWIARDAWALSDADYVDMVVKKTGWYTFITPLRTGALLAGAEAEQIAALMHLGRALAVAFQVQDDVLNLLDEQAYGKEVDGDLWEGKRTLIVLNLMRRLDADRRAEAEAVLGTPRGQKCSKAVARVRRWIDEVGAIEAAREVAAAHAQEAHDRFAAGCDWLAPSMHRRFLEDVIDYVHTRRW